MSVITKLLATDNFIMVNRLIATKLGLYEAVLIGELCNKYNYWSRENRLTEDGYFFCTAETIEADTSISVKQQQKAFENLENEGFITTTLKGLPRTKYFKINEEAIEEWLDNNGEIVRTSPVKSAELEQSKVPNKDGKNGRIIINNNNKKDINNTVSKDTAKTKRKTRKDILVEYINELTYNQDTKDILFKWLFNIGLPKGLTPEQFKDKLAQLATETDFNEPKIKTAITNSYNNGWFGFFTEKNNYKKEQKFENTTAKIHCKADTNISVSNEIF